MSRNVLMEISEPLFEFAMFFKKNYTTMSLSHSELMNNISVRFQRFEQKGFDAQISSLSMNKTKYALAALIDEVILLSKWDGKLDWARNTLQVQFFGENVAGEGFYKTLSDIRKNLPSELDVLEVYYYCIQLGFRGVYNTKSTSEVTALIHDIKLQLQSLCGGGALSLSSGMVVRKSMIDKVKKEFGIREWFLVSIVGFFVVYNIFYYLNAIDFDVVNQSLISIVKI